MATVRPPGTRALRRGRYSEPGQIYHVTTRTCEGRRYFDDCYAARAVIATLRRETRSGRCRTLAFVVMPDHLHWLVQLRGHAELAQVVNNVKAHSARAVNKRWARSGPVWQKGFYDRALRREENVRIVARYIIANPLRARIVRRIGAYPHWDAVWLP